MFASFVIPLTYCENVDWLPKEEYSNLFASFEGKQIGLKSESEWQDKYMFENAVYQTFTTWHSILERLYKFEILKIFPVCKQWLGVC